MDHIYISSRPGLMKIEDEVVALSGASSRAPMHLNTIHDVVSHPHNITLPHEHLHGVLRRTKQGRVLIPHPLHGASHREEHADCIAGTSAGPGEPRCAGPTQQAMSGSPS